MVVRAPGTQLPREHLTGATVLGLSSIDRHVLLHAADLRLHAHGFIGAKQVAMQPAGTHCGSEIRVVPRASLDPTARPFLDRDDHR